MVTSNAFANCVLLVLICYFRWPEAAAAPSIQQDVAIANQFRKGITARTIFVVSDGPDVLSKPEFSNLTNLRERLLMRFVVGNDGKFLSDLNNDGQRSFVADRRLFAESRANAAESSRRTTKPLPPFIIMEEFTMEAIESQTTEEFPTSIPPTVLTLEAFSSFSTTSSRSTTPEALTTKAFSSPISRTSTILETISAITRTSAETATTLLSTFPSSTASSTSTTEAPMTLTTITVPITTPLIMTPQTTPPPAPPTATPPTKTATAATTTLTTTTTPTTTAPTPTVPTTTTPTKTTTAATTTTEITTTPPTTIEVITSATPSTTLTSRGTPATEAATTTTTTTTTTLPTATPATSPRQTTTTATTTTSTTSTTRKPVKATTTAAVIFSPSPRIPALLEIVTAPTKSDFQIQTGVEFNTKEATFIPLLADLTGSRKPRQEFDEIVTTLATVTKTTGRTTSVLTDTLTIPTPPEFRPVTRPIIQQSLFNNAGLENLRRLNLPASTSDEPFTALPAAFAKSTTLHLPYLTSTFSNDERFTTSATTFAKSTTPHLPYMTSTFPNAPDNVTPSLTSLPEEHLTRLSVPLAKSTTPHHPYRTRPFTYAADIPTPQIFRPFIPVIKQSLYNNATLENLRWARFYEQRAAKQRNRRWRLSLKPIPERKRKRRQSLIADDSVTQSATPAATTSVTMMTYPSSALLWQGLEQVENLLNEQVDDDQATGPHFDGVEQELAAAIIGDRSATVFPSTEINQYSVAIRRSTETSDVPLSKSRNPELPVSVPAGKQETPMALHASITKVETAATPDVTLSEGTTEHVIGSNGDEISEAASSHEPAYLDEVADFEPPEQIADADSNEVLTTTAIHPWKPSKPALAATPGSTTGIMLASASSHAKARNATTSSVEPRSATIQNKAEFASTTLRPTEFTFSWEQLLDRIERGKRLDPDHFRQFLRKVAAVAFLSTKSPSYTTPKPEVHVDPLMTLDDQSRSPVTISPRSLQLALGKAFVDTLSTVKEEVHQPSTTVTRWRKYSFADQGSAATISITSTATQDAAANVTEVSARTSSSAGHRIPLAEAEQAAGLTTTAPFWLPPKTTTEIDFKSLLNPFDDAVENNAVFAVQPPPTATLTTSRSPSPPTATPPTTRPVIAPALLSTVPITTASLGPTTAAPVAHFASSIPTTVGAATVSVASSHTLTPPPATIKVPASAERLTIPSAVTTAAENVYGNAPALESTIVTPAVITAGSPVSAPVATKPTPTPKLVVLPSTTKQPTAAAMPASVPAAAPATVTATTTLAAIGTLSRPTAANPGSIPPKALTPAAVIPYGNDLAPTPPAAVVTMLIKAHPTTPAIAANTTTAKPPSVSPALSLNTALATAAATTTKGVLLTTVSQRPLTSAGQPGVTPAIAVTTAPPPGPYGEAVPAITAIPSAALPTSATLPTLASPTTLAASVTTRSPIPTPPAFPPTKANSTTVGPQATAVAIVSVPNPGTTLTTLSAVPAISRPTISTVGPYWVPPTLPVATANTASVKPSIAATGAVTSTGTTQHTSQPTVIAIITAIPTTTAAKVATTLAVANTTGTTPIPYLSVAPTTKPSTPAPTVVPVTMPTKTTLPTIASTIITKTSDLAPITATAVTIVQPASLAAALGIIVPLVEQDTVAGPASTVAATSAANTVATGSTTIAVNPVTTGLTQPTALPSTALETKPSATPKVVVLPSTVKPTATTAALDQSTTPEDYDSDAFDYTETPNIVTTSPASALTLPPAPVVTKPGSTIIVPQATTEAATGPTSGQPATSNSGDLFPSTIIAAPQPTNSAAASAAAPGYGEYSGFQSETTAAASYPTGADVEPPSANSPSNSNSQQPSYPLQPGSYSGGAQPPPPDAVQIQQSLLPSDLSLANLPPGVLKQPEWPADWGQRSSSTSQLQPHLMNVAAFQQFQQLMISQYGPQAAFGPLSASGQQNTGSFGSPNTLPDGYQPAIKTASSSDGQASQALPVVFAQQGQVYGGTLAGSQPQQQPSIPVAAGQYRPQKPRVFVVGPPNLPQATGVSSAPAYGGSNFQQQSFSSSRSPTNGASTSFERQSSAKPKPSTAVPASDRRQPPAGNSSNAGGSRSGNKNASNDNKQLQKSQSGNRGYKGVLRFPSFAPSSAFAPQRSFAVRPIFLAENEGFRRLRKR